MELRSFFFLGCYNLHLPNFNYRRIFAHHFIFVCFFLITYLTAYLTVLWWESVEFFLDHLFRANVNQKVSS